MITDEQRERIDYLEVRILYGKASREELEECRALRKIFREALEERLRSVLAELQPEEGSPGTP